LLIIADILLFGIAVLPDPSLSGKAAGFIRIDVPKILGWL
jgi:hypothetical protein